MVFIPILLLRKLNPADDSTFAESHLMQVEMRLNPRFHKDDRKLQTIGNSN